jgi:hypothetical protein
MANYYYVCTTNDCPRNKKNYFVTAKKVESLNDDRCRECGQSMIRRSRAIKGRNTKPGLHVRGASNAPSRTRGSCMDINRIFQSWPI